MSISFTGCQVPVKSWDINLSILPNTERALEMTTILLLTAGGSHQPLVKSIQTLRPDFVHFLCSDDSRKAKGSYVQVIGEGKVNKSDWSVAKPDLPNIVVLAALDDNQYDIHKIERFDDLESCYVVASRVLQKIREEEPNATVCVDYTGGTKSMTSGLVVAAMDDGACQFQIVAGRREDRVKVTDKTEFVQPIEIANTQASRILSLAKELLSQFNYAATEKLLNDMRFRYRLTRNSKLERIVDLCRAFNAWDTFNHEEAKLHLKPYRRDFVPYVQFLDNLKKEETRGFLWVEDLLLNAERRASQFRFDDATARLYRCIELLAQSWLSFQYGISTRDVDVEKLPETTKKRLSDANFDLTRTVKIGLMQSWDLIADMENDLLGSYFRENRGRILNFLKLRNQSILAHGQTPISEFDYNKEVQFVISFCRKGLDTYWSLNKKKHAFLPQFPNDFIESILE